MSCISGECHQDYWKVSLANFPEQKEIKKDRVIVCGDFDLPADLSV